jgi:hypothetical protein
MDATQAIVVGPMSISVDHLAVGTPKVTGLFGDSERFAKTLQIWIAVASVAEKKRKFDYHGVESATLTDSVGNEYRAIELGMTERVLYKHRHLVSRSICEDMSFI